MRFWRSFFPGLTFFFHDLVFFRAPFSLALLLLIAVSGLVCCLWTENYGDIGADVKISLIQGIQVVRNGQLNCSVLAILYNVSSL